MGLNVVGTRGRKDTGVPVRPPRPRYLGNARTVQHLLRWWPQTSFEITREALGFYTREWDEESKCYTCEGKGFIDRDCPHHLYEWARVRGAKCRVCSGIGRVMRMYEEKLDFSKTYVRRSQMLFRAEDGVVHLTTRKGKVRRTRCSEFKELPEWLLSSFGRCTCMVCLAWTG